MKSKIYKIIVGLLLLWIDRSDEARLLGIFPMPGSSHYILANQLMKGFAKAGHHVTFITPYPTKGIPKNASWDDLILEGLVEDFQEKVSNINLFEDNKRSGAERSISYQHILLNWVNVTLFHPKVRALLTPDTKFDAVIIEQFYNDAHKYFAYYFQCPLILMASMGICTFKLFLFSALSNSNREYFKKTENTIRMPSIGPAPWVNNIVGNPMPPAYIPHSYNKGDFDFENFWQRLFNLYDHVCDYLVEKFYLHPLHNQLLQHAFPGAPSIDKLNENVALVLVNSHESLLEAVPLVPNMVQIGGYHIEPPGRLPKDIQEFLDNAKDGVIYFSMGSVIKANEMPNEKREIFSNVFKKLNQKVLWKFENDNDPKIPKNVLVKSWMPQGDILAHPNIKLFITHGGMLSTTETIYHGVPVLAIPVFADQFMNAGKAVRYGYGLSIPFSDKNFNEETLLSLIQELLTDPKYKENAQRRSRLYHDRPMKPMENAVYWLEYVIRHHGANHLKVAGAKLPLYKYLMLDVIAAMLAITLLCFYIILLGYKKLISKIRASNKKQKTN